MLVHEISAADIRPMGIPGADIVLHLENPPGSGIFLSVEKAEEMIAKLEAALNEIRANPHVEIINLPD
jgi:hypothetical protein